MADEKDEIGEMRAVVEGLKGELADSRAAMERVVAAGREAAARRSGVAAGADAAAIKRSDDWASAVGHNRPLLSLGMKIGKPEKYEGSKRG